MGLTEAEVRLIDCELWFQFTKALIGHKPLGADKRTHYLALRKDAMRRGEYGADWINQLRSRAFRETYGHKQEEFKL